MFPEQIYHPIAKSVPDISLQIIRHIALGEGVIRVNALANGLEAKRLTQHMYGAYVNKIPVWAIQDRIVADWFALLLEEKYQEAISGQTVVVFPYSH